MPEHTGTPIDFHCQTWGDASRPTLVMLHGFMGYSGDFADLATALADKYFCMAVDLPGHGATTVSSPDGFDFLVCAEQLCSFLDRRGTGRCFLYGYSMGARLALHLALSYPDCWTGLILESGSPGLRTKEERELRANSDESLARQIESEPLNLFLERWLAQPLFRSLHEEGRAQELLRSRADNDPNGLASALRGMSTGRQPSHWEDIDQLGIPTLLITGQKDLKFTSVAKQMAAAQAGINHQVVADAGHNVHFERPSEFATVVLEFLRKHGSH
ncbi:MAG: 2-succinyl-6-hydroxy-2,4-cyclohexadiene-1-carboxylate synthase [bacterium]